tara:strand:- start:35 stop:418 length:384 start_codon:yes stop_codon:yes gene_type:complete
MIINESPYAEISEDLKNAIGSEQSLDWEVIGDYISAIIQSGEQQFFTDYNLLDFAMQVYEAGGEDSILKRYQCQFELAKIYSEQGGLKRKFKLTRVNSKAPKFDSHNPSTTRSLNCVEIHKSPTHLH